MKMKRMRGLWGSEVMFVNVKVSDLDYRLLAAGYREVARRLVFRRW